MNNTIRTTSGKCINVSEIKVGDKVRVIDRNKIVLGRQCLTNGEIYEVKIMQGDKVWITDDSYKEIDSCENPLVLDMIELQGIELVDDELIAEMNNDFSNEQIEAYASAFEEGDAIKIDGNWHKVDLEDAYPDGRKSHTAHVIGNYHVINNLNDLGGCTGVTYGFREDEEIAILPYQITTLEDYELKGGERLVRLGESVLGVTFGKVYRTVNVFDGVDIIDNDGDNHRPLNDNRWGVIPRYEQIKHSDNPPKKEPKFKVGDKVTVVSVFTGVVESFDDQNNIYGVKMINKEGESHIGYYLEQDLCPYVEEPKIKSSFERETERIIKELHDTLVKKNADYGNSFTKSYEKRGIVSAIIRMEDKFNRLNQLYDKDSSKVNESLYDTVLDLAGYAILTARELKKGEGSGQD